VRTGVTVVAGAVKTGAVRIGVNVIAGATSIGVNTGDVRTGAV
jgi:hypothetical protein